ncbi:hypothetical protein EIP86_006759, partial [Pleurotus ostreatoroseus]
TMLTSRTYNDDDPLARVLAPPPNETPEDRARRLHAEEEAKRISDAIDEEIQQQQKAEKKTTRPIKILLLAKVSLPHSHDVPGPPSYLHSRSQAFRAERASWRAVILLNVVRSIRVILEAIADIQALQSSSPTASPTMASRSLPGSRPASAPPPDEAIPQLTQEHLKLRLRLVPLLQVEEVLVRKLNPVGSSESEATHVDQTNVPREVAVNSQFRWKGIFNRITGGRGSLDTEAINWEDPDDPGRIIHACGDDMIRLWNDPTIQQGLEYQKIRLQDQPGFFMDCLERVTAPRYVPTDVLPPSSSRLRADDVLRARLKTLGVSEYRFQVKDGFGSSTREWRVYDVGGHRSLVSLSYPSCDRAQLTHGVVVSQRAAWAPFFDDMNAILFLAPISCFDQVLAEDQSVNRLEDSVLLWKSIVSNPLLGKTSLVLFLNKTDILKDKLAAGIRFGHFIVSYGNRPNDYESTSTCAYRFFCLLFSITSAFYFRSLVPFISHFPACMNFSPSPTPRRIENRTLTS